MKESIFIKFSQKFIGIRVLIIVWYIVQAFDFVIKFLNKCQQLRVVFSNIWSFPTKARA
jgi:hypothetical protein